MTSPTALDAAPASLPRAARDAVIGIGFLCVMDALIKLLSARYPVLEIAFLRFAFGSLAILAILAVVRPPVPSRETVRINFVRALLVVATAVCFFYALSVLPLADTVALSFLAPIFMALFAALFLGERLDRRVLAALAIGFSGMLVIVFGGIGLEAGARNLLGIGAALTSAVTYALAMVLLRARARRDGIAAIVAFQNVFPALVLAGPAAFVWTPLALSDTWLFALIGALGVSGHLMLARAFRAAEAARLAPLDYTSLVWASVLGFVLFAEVPGVATIAGAGLIVAAALVVSRR